MVTKQHCVNPAIEFNLLETLKQDTDQCVRCGLCLPHCPTYQLTHNENESPRGRIALAKAFAEDKIKVNTTGMTYLNHCVNCLACESMCPSKVPYQRIINQTKTLLNNKTLLQDPSQKLRTNTLKWLYLWIRTMPTSLRFILRCLHILKRFKLIRRALTYLFPVLPSLPKYQCSHKRKQNQATSTTPTNTTPVNFFSGCVTHILEQPAIDAALALLQTANLSVSLCKRRACCGGLYRRLGQEKKAQALYDKTCSQLDTRHPTIAITSGCLAELAFAAREKQNQQSKVKTNHNQKNTLNFFDIFTFLKTQTQIHNWQFKALPKKIMLHFPCSLTYALHQQHAILELLKKIPACEIILFEKQLCCGAAGSHFIQQPARATAMISPLIQEIENHRPDLFLTSNIGCRCHFENHLTKQNWHIEIYHPIEILWQQLIPPTNHR